MTTMPGMIAVIDAAVAGGLAATVAVALGLGAFPALVTGVVAGLAMMAALAALATQVFEVQGQSLEHALPGGRGRRRRCRTVRPDGGTRSPRRARSAGAWVHRGPPRAPRGSQWTCTSTVRVSPA